MRSDWLLALALLASTALAYASGLCETPAQTRSVSEGRPAGDSAKRFVFAGKDGKLVYDIDARGNRMPDFSHCGYMGGGVAIPEATVRVVVPPSKEDNGPRIQTAIEMVSRLAADAHGIRGAVLLLAGRHEVAGKLRITTGGVVLRGQKGATLVATGTDRRTLIEIHGEALGRTSRGVAHAIADPYVPVGAYRVRLDSAKGLEVGNTVVITHPSTKAWIAALGMNRFPARDKGSYLDWIPGTMDVRWDRVITKIENDSVTLDAPLTMALDSALSKSTLQTYAWPGRIQQVGVENLRCETSFDRDNPHDEQHAWNLIGIENAQNVWVRQVSAAYFAGSVVSVWESCKAITIEDCTSAHPVSEIGGYRRHTYYTSGQLTLVRRCKAHRGRHDFAVGYLAAGPNAFVECEAASAHQFSGPIESWATGVLYDRVTIDGGALALTNRETDDQGAGWATANSVLWQCTAPIVTCRMPPSGQNWAIGCWGHCTGDGHWRSMNQFFKPESLYAAQLADRLGERVSKLGKKPTISLGAGATKTIDELAPDAVRAAYRKKAAPKKRFRLKNGWLVCDDELITGGRTGTVWWRGHLLPERAAAFGIGITRFAPGRFGPGFTDILDELTDEMRAKNLAILEHHWGLWYDRRRDDHQMVRRIDGDVWPPFCEQPWARSGQGKAWDGLSKYDLTKFNKWYFDRLKAFADHGEQKGLLLVQQMYFQHNLLEAGAHWADFPWRPANCLQATGFAEPPPYENNKRIFMAKAFYDMTHPVRRQLHRAYIRHCLDELGNNSNVVFQTGEEFTGPLAFVRFWIDTIAEWQKEKNRKVLVSLSCTKDVQDAILADPVRGAHVSIIDLRYWWYTTNGGVYDPKGDENRAPRQQLREWQGSKSRSDASLARQIREYRQRYPDKAALCSLDPANGWAVLAAGGSVPHLPLVKHADFRAALPRMKPFAASTLTELQWAIAEPGRNYLVYSAQGQPIRLDLKATNQRFTGYWIDQKTGDLQRQTAIIPGGREVVLYPPGSASAVLWLTVLEN
jgi:hypothetical protein